MRHRTPDPPARIAAIDGLAYSLWLPDGPPEGGVVIIHGADSSKESHHDFARVVRDAGFAAVAYDLRGHGDSPGPLDGRLLDDVATVAGLLAPGPVALRGSSLGGFVAIAAAERAGAGAVVAICPAPVELLVRGLRSGRFGFPFAPDLESALVAHPLPAVVARSVVPLMLLHAEADDRVPVAASVALDASSAGTLRSLVVIPGGHHGSVQHDPELQGEAVRFIRRAFARGDAGATSAA